MRSLIYMLSLLFSLTPVLAQTGSLKGTVVDENGEEILFAVIRVMDGEEFIAGNQTDWLGRFRILPLQPGDYQIKVTAEGEEKWIDHVRIVENEETEIEIRMKMPSPDSSVVRLIPLIKAKPVTIDTVMEPSRRNHEILRLGGNGPAVLVPDSLIRKEEKEKNQ